MKRLTGFLVGLLVGGLLICPSVADAKSTPPNPAYSTTFAVVVANQVLDSFGLEADWIECTDGFFGVCENCTISFTYDHARVQGLAYEEPEVYGILAGIVAGAVFMSDDDAITAFKNFIREEALFKSHAHRNISGVLCSSELSPNGFVEILLEW